MKAARSSEVIINGAGHWLLLAGMALLALAFVACTHGRTAQAKKVSPVVLALLALAPADLGGAYTVSSDQYVDDDGQPSAQPTHEFERRLTLKPPAKGAAPPASNILI